MGNLSGERGQHVQEYSEASEGAQSKVYIVYAPQCLGWDGNAKDDPEAEYVIDGYYIAVAGLGTIQFFREHVQTLVASQLSEEIPLDDVHTPHVDSCIWRPGPLHDVYYTTTGDVDVSVRLKTHVIRNSFAPGVEIIP